MQPVQIEGILAELRQQRDRFDAAIAALEDGHARRGRPAGARGRRRMSAAARKRISLAMKRRWAARKKAA